MFQYSEKLLQASLWANCARFGSADEIIEALENFGESAGEALDEFPLDANGGGRVFFEIIWDRALAEKDQRPAQWAKVTELLAASHRVDHRLRSGRLPLAQLAEWGPVFWDACEAFCQAGANAWKKDGKRVSAMDAARRSGALLKAPWAIKAARSHDRLATDSAREDLIKNDLTFDAKAAPITSQEWAARFAWENDRRIITFDLQCAYLLTSRFSPAEALSVWKAALGSWPACQKDLANWALSCVCGDLSDLPEKSDISAVTNDEFSRCLGQAAVERGLSDGSSLDPERSQELIEKLMRASEAFGADFYKAAQPFADQALSWKLPQHFSADPYAKAFAGDQLLAALESSRANWERHLLSESVSPAATRPSSSRL